MSLDVNKEITKEDLSKNGLLIKDVKEKTEELQIIAVKNNPLSVEYIENLSEALWNSLKYIKNPTEKIIKRALEVKGWAIQYVENPTYEMKLLAIESDFDSIRYIDNPEEELQKKAIEKYWGAIKYIKNPTLESKLLAITKSEEAINFMSNYSYDEIKDFLSANINVFKYVYDSVDIDIVLEVLKEKFEDGTMTYEYMKSYIDLEMLEMDKLEFVKTYGDRMSKKFIVDCVL